MTVKHCKRIPVNAHMRAGQAYALEGGMACSMPQHDVVGSQSTVQLAMRLASSDNKHS